MAKKMRFTLIQKALLSFAVVLLPLVITFFIGYTDNRDYYKKFILDDLGIISDAYEAQVYQFLEMGKRRAHDFSSDGVISGVAQRATFGLSFSSKALSEHLKRNKAPLDKTIREILVISATGKVIASTHGEDAGKDFSKMPFFSKGMEGPHAAELFSGIHGSHDLVFSAPIIDQRTGRVTGVLANITDLSELNKLLAGKFSKEQGAITSAKGRHGTQEIYLVNANKIMLTDSIFIKDAAFRQKVDTEPVNACLKNNHETSGFYPDYRGVEVAGVSDCLQNLKWTLIIEVDADDILSASNEQLRNAAIGMGAAMAVIAALMIIILKKLVLPLQRLVETAHGISKGNYDVPAMPATGDEVGALGEAFKSMAEGIKARDAGLKAEMERTRTYLDVAGVIFLVLNSTGKVLLINKKGCEILGYGYADVIGRNWLDMFIPDRDRTGTKDTFEKVISGAMPPYEYYENVILAKDGTERIIAWQNAVLRSESGKISATVSSGSDVTEIKRAEEAALKTAERTARQQKAVIMLSARAATVQESLGEAVKFISKTAGDTLEAEHTCIWLLGDTTAALKCINHYNRGVNAHSPGISFNIDSAPHYLSALESGVAIAADDAKNDKRTAELYEAFLKPNGVVSFLSAPIRVAGKLKGALTFSHKGNARKWLEDEARFASDIAGHIAQAMINEERQKKEQELKKLSMVIDHSVNVVFITTADGTIEYINPMFESVTGYAAEEVLGKNASILASGETRKEEYLDMWHTIMAGETWHGIFKNRKKDGAFYWCNAVITPIRDDLGRITRFLSVQEDITQRRVSEEKLHMLEDFDTLTGIFNRSRFMNEINNCLPGALKEHLQCVLMVIDLDRFQFLNDTYGHPFGDQTLKRVAYLIEAEVRQTSVNLRLKPEGFCGRLSSDEFSVFLPGFGAAEGVAAAESIRSAIERFNFQTAGQERVRLTASIGAVVFPGHGATISELFSKADAAMFRAKELGRNRTRLYTPDDKDLEDMHLRLTQKERILKALEEDRFTPWFQPILSLKDNAISHYEALARLRAEDGSVLLPGAFIDTAERFGLIGSIDRVMIEKTMRQQAALAGQGKACTFSMNLSGKELGDSALLEFLKERLAASGADAKCLVFEITETAAIRDFDKAVKFIRDLKSLGFHFSLDDFGVGFTSFRYLKDMNVDYIKIDGSFIKRLDEDATDRLFVKAITSVAGGMGITTVAEFVEREAVLNLLKEFGVDYAQGYFIGKPAPDVL